VIATLLLLPPLLIAALEHAVLGASPLTLPNRADSLKFAVIGDNGTGDRPEYEVAAQMIAARQAFAFETRARCSQLSRPGCSASAVLRPDRHGDWAFDQLLGGPSDDYHVHIRRRRCY
jgi:hypothetical protein